MFSRKALKTQLTEIIEYKTKSSQGKEFIYQRLIFFPEERMQLVKDLQKRYPGRIPVIFLKSRKTKAPQIENNK